MTSKGGFHMRAKTQREVSVKSSRKRGRWVIHIVLILFSILMLLPFLWMLLTSFKTFGESVKIPPVLFPEAIPGKILSGEKGLDYLFTNYKTLLGKIDYFWDLYVNTFLLIGGRILCAIVTSSMAAYGFAKLEFPLKKFLFSVVLVQLMLPNQIFIVPQFKMVVALNLHNTVGGLIFPGLVSAFGTFFMRQFYMSLPRDMSEAAYIDGCNHWKIFTRIMFPLTKTPLMALSIFTAIFAWSDLMWPLIVNSENRMGTLSSALAKIQMMDIVFKAPHMMAASVLAMIPMVVLYLVFQKQFVEGIAQTGLKA